MEFKLYFENQHIGFIEQRDEDFLNFFGKYRIISSVEKDQEFILDYIKYSVQASIFMEEDEKKWQAYMEKEESKYLELINSENWSLIDELGKIHKILVPNFCDRNEIIWRLNIGV